MEKTVHKSEFGKEWQGSCVDVRCLKIISIQTEWFKPHAVVPER